jgi:hypothetical protein
MMKPTKKISSAPSPSGQWSTITVRIQWETHLAVRRHVLDMRAAGVKTSIAETVNHALLYYLNADHLR